MLHKALLNISRALTPSVKLRGFLSSKKFIAHLVNVCTRWVLLSVVFVIILRRASGQVINY